MVQPATLLIKLSHDRVYSRRDHSNKTLREATEISHHKFEILGNHSRSLYPRFPEICVINMAHVECELCRDGYFFVFVLKLILYIIQVAINDSQLGRYFPRVGRYYLDMIIKQVDISYTELVFLTLLSAFTLTTLSEAILVDADVIADVDSHIHCNKTNKM